MSFRPKEGPPLGPPGPDPRVLRAILDDIPDFDNEPGLFDDDRAMPIDLNVRPRVSRPRTLNTPIRRRKAPR